MFFLCEVPVQNEDNTLLRHEKNPDNVINEHA